MSRHNKLGLIKGTVLEIQRMSTEDGPGIRTTVFLKGCPLRCLWCHNPESISPVPQIHWIGSRCIGCKTCLDVCPEGAISLTEDGIVINRGICKGCGSCAEECPSTALEILGKEWNVDDLIREVKKDKAYFDKSGGGITLSGGEPTIQPEFSRSFLKGLRSEGIHTALDTCGLCTMETLDSIMPYVDLLLYDIKEIDPSKHKEFTGSTNERILGNLMNLPTYLETHLYPKHLWIRTPIIPSATAREDNIRGIGKYIADNLGSFVDRWELCAFNNLCKDKYGRLGIDWMFKDCELMATSEIEKLADVARTSGVNPDIVHWNGSTKIEKPDIGQHRSITSPAAI
jgi:pyruvate formate lyase activating enzyme